MNAHPGIRTYIYGFPLKTANAVAKLPKGVAAHTQAQQDRGIGYGFVSTLTFSSAEFAFGLLAKFSRHTKSIDPPLPLPLLLCSFALFKVEVRLSESA